VRSSPVVPSSCLHWSAFVRVPLAVHRLNADVQVWVSVCSSTFPRTPFQPAFSEFPLASASMGSTPGLSKPRFFHSSFAINPFSIRQPRYPLASSRHSSSFFPRWLRRHRRYDEIKCLHSASWSRGKEPRSGLAGNQSMHVEYKGDTYGVGL
jgi:hypothetical protein